MMDIQKFIFVVAQSLPGFLLAIVVHEWAHGYMAKVFGDDTAEKSGRLTLNPAAHIDPMGTIIFPLIGLSLGGMVFGWAKPVPVDVRKLSNYKKGIFWVSFAGPIANFIIGIFSCLIYAIIATQVPQNFSYFAIILEMLNYSIMINFILGTFNLIPLPPLDGSKMLASFLKGEALRKYEDLARFTPMIFLAIIGLSFMGISTLGHILTPAVMIGQKLTMYFLYLLG
jgi:Zn-dependent protease